MATVDGTTATSNSWTCPQVTPNSAIYFYQFTSPASNNTYWTTRFAIADANGNTTPPTQQTQPGSGAKIPWGTGALTNSSASKPPPTGGSTSPASVTGTALSTQVSSTADVTATSSSTSGSSSSVSGVAGSTYAVSATSSAAGGASTTANGAASVDARSLQITAALAAAIGFTALL